jgi:hypothetical protein
VGVIGDRIQGEAFGRGFFVWVDGFLAECFAPTIVGN